MKVYKMEKACGSSANVKPKIEEFEMICESSCRLMEH